MRLGGHEVATLRLPAMGQPPSGRTCSPRWRTRCRPARSGTAAGAPTRRRWRPVMIWSSSRTVPARPCGRRSHVGRGAAGPGRSGRPASPRMAPCCRPMPTCASSALASSAGSSGCQAADHVVRRAAVNQASSRCGRLTRARLPAAASPAACGPGRHAAAPPGDVAHRRARGPDLALRKSLSPPSGSQHQDAQRSGRSPVRHGSVPADGSGTGGRLRPVPVSARRWPGALRAEGSSRRSRNVAD
jgi:hypothetical protein